MGFLDTLIAKLVVLIGRIKAYFEVQSISGSPYLDQTPIPHIQQLEYNKPVVTMEPEATKSVTPVEASETPVEKPKRKRTPKGQGGKKTARKRKSAVSNAPTKE